MCTGLRGLQQMGPWVDSLPSSGVTGCHCRSSPLYGTATFWLNVLRVRTYEHVNVWTYERLNMRKCVWCLAAVAKTYVAWDDLKMF